MNINIHINLYIHIHMHMCIYIYIYTIYIYIPISWSFNLQEVRNRFLPLADPSCPKEKLIRDQRLQGFKVGKINSPFCNFTIKQSHHEIDDENDLPCAGKSQDCREDSHLQRYLPKFTQKKKSKRDIRHTLKVTIIFHILQQGNIITFNIVICFSSTSSSINSFKSPCRALQSANSTMHQTTTGRMTSVFWTQLSAIHGSVIQWYTDTVDDRLFIRLSSFVHIYPTTYRLRYWVYPCVYHDLDTRSTG